MRLYPVLVLLAACGSPFEETLFAPAAGTTSSISSTSSSSASSSSAASSSGTGGAPAVSGTGGAMGTGGSAPTCADCGGVSCCEARVVPGGTFPMGRSLAGADAYPSGQPDELPEHFVKVLPFHLDVFEVTVGRFRSFVDATGAKADLLCDQVFATWTEKIGKHERLPINCVDWATATAFCAWDGGRLPTETEWEYAAAGGEQNRLYPWGSQVPDGSLAVMGCAFGGSPGSCDFSDVAPVGSVPAGAGRWGQQDMAGSMWEWTSSDYDAAQKTLRGGNFGEDASYIRAARRTSRDAMSRSNDFGIRCAR